MINHYKNGITILKQCFMDFRVINHEVVCKYSSALWLKKQNSLFLFAPQYHDCIHDYRECNYLLDIEKNITIVLSNKVVQVSLYNVYRHDGEGKYQTAIILQYILPPQCFKENFLKIEINKKIHIVSPCDLEKKDGIAISTVFKYDYSNLQLYIDFYRKIHNIKRFILFFNGNIEKITHHLKSIAIEDTEVVIYELNLPYWQNFCLKQHWTDVWAHSCQSIQLAMAAVLSAYYSSHLLCVDLDEYIDDKLCIEQLLKHTEVAYFLSKTTKCDGKFCRQKKKISLEELLEQMHSHDFEKVIDINIYDVWRHDPKFMQKTNGIKLRLVHQPVTANQPTVAGYIYHYKCLSPSSTGPRHCS
jgi:hypothetical protein